MIVMPSSLKEYFEMLANLTEPKEMGGLGMSLETINEMMPWQLDALLNFKFELQEKRREQK